MVRIPGAGRSVRAPDTSGVQRAHEGLMRTYEQGAQQAQQLGQAVSGAVANVQQQGAQQSELELRRQRLQMEMAKEGLEYQGEGASQKIVPSAESAQMADREMATKEQRALTEAIRVREYHRANSIQLAKAMQQSDDPAQVQRGQEALNNLAKEYKKDQKLFEDVILGRPGALEKAQDQLPDVPQPDMPEDMEKVVGPMSGMGAGMFTQRVVSNVRARLDKNQMEFIVNSHGHMPEDAMDDSPAWRTFHGWKQQINDILKSGVMMVPNFKSIQERNRFLNEAAAQMVLSGQPLPGSLAGESVTQGLIPAMQSPAGPHGGADDGSQPATPGVGGDANPLAGRL